MDMRIYRQKRSKKWRVRFSVNLIKYDRPLYTEDREVAEVKARQLKREIEHELAGLCPPKKLRDAAATPLHELHSDWLAIGLSPDVKEKHRNYCHSRPLKVFKECGWRYLRDVTPISFQKWLNDNRRAGLHQKTLNEYRGHLFSFLGWLKDQGMIADNPLRTIKPMKLPTSDSKRALSPEELRRLCEAAPWYRRCLYVFAAHTGLRRVEMRELTWNRIHLDGDVPCMELDPTTTKNGKRDLLPLLPDVVDALRELRQKSPSYRDKVFYKGITENRRLRSDMEHAGIPLLDSRGRRIEFHSFRRTFATILANSNVSPSVAKKMMRHASISLTLELYADHHLIATVEEMQKVPRLLPSSPASPQTGKTCPSLSKLTSNGDKAASGPTTGKPLHLKVFGNFPMTNVSAVLS